MQVTTSTTNPTMSTDPAQDAPDPLTTDTDDNQIAVCPECKSSQIRRRMPSMRETETQTGAYYCPECDEEYPTPKYRKRQQEDRMSPERILSNLGVDVDAIE